MTTHTPGPWLVYKGPMNMDGGLNPFFRGIVALLKHSGEDDDVCVILDRNEEAHDYEANAYLIAAAPELLEAAQTMLSRFDNTSSYGFVNGSDLRQLRAAIARAKGEHASPEAICHHPVGEYACTLASGHEGRHVHV